MPDTHSELTELSAFEMSRRIYSREISAADLVEQILTRIEEVQPVLNAFTYVRADEAMEEARLVDSDPLPDQRDKPLYGVPITIKDNVAMAGAPMTVGSRLLRDNIATEDSVIVERLRAAGAIIVARTNTPEFAWRGSTDNLLFGETRNPWDVTKTAGGSSGGAAAAVASGAGPLALGTDGAGSIRIPASFCGIFGIKPSVGRIPLNPSLGLMETAANAGPITRTVADAALMLDVMAGPDDRDRVSLPDTGERFSDAVGKPISEMKLAWSANLGHIPVDPEIESLCRLATQAFVDAGATVDVFEGELLDPAPIQEVFYASVQAGAHGLRPQSELAQMDPGLVAITEKGKRLTAVDVGQMWFARGRYWEAMRQVYQHYDLLLTPTISVPAFDLGIVGPTEVNGNPVIHLGWTLAYPFNLTGQPAATVPCGFTSSGLPVGLQIVGNRFDEFRVLQAAAAFEAISPWKDNVPNIPTA